MGQAVVFAGATLRSEPSYDSKHERLVHFPLRGSTSIPAIMLRPTTRNPRRSGFTEGLCVIYFHAISCDIGDCSEDLASIRDVAFGGNAAVLAPEYPGYGLLRNQRTTVEDINQVAWAALDFCRRSLGFAQDRIVLWGRSIGTGPATALARACADPKFMFHIQDKSAVTGCCGPPLLVGIPGSDPCVQDVAVSMGCCGSSTNPPESKVQAVCKNGHTIASPFVYSTQAIPWGSRPLGGLVLVAPLSSMEDVVLAITRSPTVSKMVGPMWRVADLVKCPALSAVPLCVIHAKDDDLVPFSQGEAVLSGAVMRPKLGIWLEGGGHNFSLLQDGFTITSCGEPRAVGLWLSVGIYCGRHAYQKQGESHGVVYWNTEFSEWRLYFKDVANTATLFHSSVNSMIAPISGWKANDSLSTPPVLEKHDQPLVQLRSFMSEHASHGGVREDGTSWEWNVPLERVYSKTTTASDDVGTSDTEFAKGAPSEETMRLKPFSTPKISHKPGKCLPIGPQDFFG